jgi:hypothetical protein
MSLIHPIDHTGYTLLEGYVGTIKQSGSEGGTPWETYLVQTIPISASDYALHVKSVAPTGSITGSAGVVVYGSGSDGLPHAIAAVLSEDGSGQYVLRTDTELNLSGNIVISNVKVYSTNGLSSSLVYGRAKTDGTVYATPDYSRATHSLDPRRHRCR